MIIDRNAFLDVLQKVVGITERYSIMPMLKNVKVVFGETSSIAATDLDVSAIVALPSADENMNLIINGRLLCDIFKGLEKGDVEVISSGKIVYVRQGKTVYTLAMSGAEDYPLIDSDIKDIKGEFEIDSKTFLDAIKRVDYAASDDESRYALCGVRLTSRNGKLATVGTDGFRLSMIRKDFPLLLEGVTIPKKSLGNIYNIVSMGEQVNVAVGKGAIKFVTATSMLICRTIDAAYPELDGVISINGDHDDATVDRSEFLRAVKKVMVMAPKDRLVKVEIANGILTLEAEGDVGKAKEAIPLVYDGSGVVFHVNGRYIIDFLINGTDEKIVLKVPKPECAIGRSIFFLGKDSSTLGVVMPVRV